MAASGIAGAIATATATAAVIAAAIAAATATAAVIAAAIATPRPMDGSAAGLSARCRAASPI